MKIYVTGIGLISAIGTNVEENYNSLISERSGIRKIKFPGIQKDLFLGKIEQSDEAIIKERGLERGPYSRTSLLGLSAAKEAWKNNSQHKVRSGFISATTVGGMDRTEKYYQQLLKQTTPDINLVVTHDSGNTTEKIAKELGLSGYINTLSTACSSSANAIMLGARLIEQHKLDRVLVGGTDALTSFTINGFDSLFIFDKEFCKPFDENRNGLNLGEGAAYLVLENEKSLTITKNKPHCVLRGWHNAADAFHQTASSPDGKGATLSMQNALRKADLEPKDISYINAHGTGTKNNDLSESVAIKNVFGEQVPAFSSTKSYTGHTLAAAGAIEAVFSILAIEKDHLFPNLNFSDPISETGLQPQKKLGAGKIQNVLSNSFGFGGNNTSLIFSKA